MRQSVLGIICLTWISGGGCASDELPDPPVNMLQVVPRGPAGTYRTARSRGVGELYLTRSAPSHTFWNDWETKQDAWGTITLKNVERDGTVVIDFSGTELRARPNRVFPGTGITVAASNPSLGTALLRTLWTRTVIETPRPPAAGGS
jgi:hypothetical protein